MPTEFQYPDMFKTLFADQPNRTGFCFSSVPVIDDAFPKTVNDYDDYLVTGSAYGVYDDAFYNKINDVYSRCFLQANHCRGLFWPSDYRACARGMQRGDDGWGIGTMPIKIVGKADWIPTDIDRLDLIHVPRSGHNITAGRN